MTFEKYFKRINFFNGFRTGEKDWQDAEKYHNDKRKLHNSRLHTIGIVNGLEVKAGSDGKACFVEPGLAIDGNGNELYLAQPSEPILLEKEKYKNADFIYIGMVFSEKPIDERPVVGASDPSTSPAFIEESVNIFDSPEKPDNKNQLELARINLSKGWDQIKNALSQIYVKENDIDMRYRLVSGAKSHLCISGHRTISDNDNQPIHFQIEKIHFIESDQPEHRFYLASVHTGETGNGQITWKISSEIKEDYIQYELIVEREVFVDETIYYQVRRLC